MENVADENAVLAIILCSGLRGVLHKYNISFWYCKVRLDIQNNLNGQHKKKSALHRVCPLVVKSLKGLRHVHVWNLHNFFNIHVCPSLRRHRPAHLHFEFLLLYHKITQRKVACLSYIWKICTLGHFQNPRIHEARRSWAKNIRTQHVNVYWSWASLNLQGKYKSKGEPFNK